MEGTLLLTYALCVVITLALGYFITNWYHQINKRVRLQESQLYLLGRIAEKNGVDMESIHKAYNHAQGFKSLQEELKG